MNECILQNVRMTEEKCQKFYVFYLKNLESFLVPTDLH